MAWPKQQRNSALSGGYASTRSVPRYRRQRRRPTKLTNPTRIVGLLHDVSGLKADRPPRSLGRRFVDGAGQTNVDSPSGSGPNRKRRPVIETG